MILCMVNLNMSDLYLNPVESFKPLKHVIPTIAKIMPNITRKSPLTCTLAQLTISLITEDAVHLFTNGIVNSIVCLNGPWLDN